MGRKAAHANVLVAVMGKYSSSKTMYQRYYEKEFKRDIVRRHIEGGQTIKSLSEEYGVSKTSIKTWCKEFSKECQNKAKKDPTVMIIKTARNTRKCILQPYKT